MRSCASRSADCWGMERKMQPCENGSASCKDGWLTWKGDWRKIAITAASRRRAMVWATSGTVNTKEARRRVEGKVVTWPQLADGGAAGQEGHPWSERMRPMPPALRGSGWSHDRTAA